MPRRVDHDEQRSMLLDQWNQMIADDGYRSASMRKLARAANVSTGSLYHYFPTKAAILAAAFEHLVKDDLASLAGGLPDDASDVDRIAALLGFVERKHAHLRAVLLVGLEVVRHEPEQGSKTAVQGAMAVYRDATATVLNTPSDTLCNAAFRYLIGLTVDWVLDPESTPPNVHTTAAVWSALKHAGQRQNEAGAV